MKKPRSWSKPSGCANTAGMLGYIQLGFIYQGIVFLHETTTEWYERYQSLLENIESFQDIVIDDAHSHDDEDE